VGIHAVAAAREPKNVADHRVTPGDDDHEWWRRI